MIKNLSFWSTLVLHTDIDYRLNFRVKWTKGGMRKLQETWSTGRRHGSCGSKCTNIEENVGAVRQLTLSW